VAAKIAAPQERVWIDNALVFFLLLVNVANFLGELLQGVLVSAVLQLKVCDLPSVSEPKPGGDALTLLLL
jgi:hypothetical protein